MAIQEPKDSGSFINGFGIGLLTGAAAYLLFGTEQGKELRKKALSEWENVKGDLETSGVEVPKQLKTVLRDILGAVASTIQEVQDLKETAGDKKSLTSSKKTESKSKQKASDRFKGL
ncbi:YtxH domain-containing protein [Candidatus Woesebacteria bacterium]|nr:YtxH domain-containing protein [Candidatus Woesebacteria bacterium]